MSTVSATTCHQNQVPQLSGSNKKRAFWLFFCYSFRANRRAIGHAECSHTPSPQSLSDRALRDSFGNMNVPSSQAVLWLRTAPSGSGAVSAWVAFAKQLRLVQLLRSDDRGHCLAMVTRSIAKGYAAWVAIVKDKNNGLNGMAPKGTTLYYKDNLHRILIVYDKFISYF